jgi:hypothetical protein
MGKQQNHRGQQQWQRRTATSAAVVALPVASPAPVLSIDPRSAWRGFFVAFYYFFGFYFYGFRQTPARAGAVRMLE